MKELITEDQANQIILIFCVAVTVVSLAVAFYLNRSVQKSKRGTLWTQAILFAILGPVLWAFWEVYNSIENFYGLDSVKALGINFAIAVGLGLVFFLLFHFLPGWVKKKRVSNRV